MCSYLQPPSSLCGNRTVCCNLLGTTHPLRCTSLRPTDLRSIDDLSDDLSECRLEPASQPHPAPDFEPYHGYLTWPSCASVNVSVQNRACNIIETCLTPSDMDSIGWLYIASRAQFPKVFTLGFTQKTAQRPDVQIRIREKGNKCNYWATGQHYREVLYPRKLESIAHAFLSFFRLLQLVCTSLRCEISHTENFEVDIPSAIRLVDMLAEWANNYKPYADDGVLKPEWQHRLADFRRSWTTILPMSLQEFFRTDRRSLQLYAQPNGRSGSGDFRMMRANPTPDPQWEAASPPSDAKYSRMALRSASKRSALDRADSGIGSYKASSSERSLDFVMTEDEESDDQGRSAYRKKGKARATSFGGPKPTTKIRQRSK